MDADGAVEVVEDDVFVGGAIVRYLSGPASLGSLNDATAGNLADLGIDAVAGLS